MIHFVNHIVRVGVILAILLKGNFLYGQVKVSDKGNFQVDFGRGCVPLAVNVTNLNLGFSGPPQYDYEFIINPPTLTLDTFYTYTSAGSFTLLQAGPTIITTIIDSVEIEVFDPLNPDFNILACSNNRAIVDLPDTYYDWFRIFYTPTDSVDVVQGGVVPTFTYPSQGTYNITVKGFFNNAQNNCGMDTKSFSTIGTSFTPAQISSLEVTNIDNTNGTVRINYSLSSSVAYRLEMTPANRTTGFFVQQILQDPDSVTVPNLNTRDFFYCFRVVAFDACTGVSVSSDTICSGTLTVEPKEGFNQVRWNTPILNFSNYEISKDSLLFQVVTDPFTNSLQDSAIICNQQICYSLQITYTNGLTSSVPDVCVISLSGSDPVPVTNITSSVVGEDVTVDWDITNPTGILQYAVYRNSNFLDSASTNSFTDSNASPSQAQVCYQISYLDQCGNSSELSPNSCPVFVKRTTQYKTELDLGWSAYLGWDLRVREYFVEKYDQDGNLINTTSVGTLQAFEEPIDQSQPQTLFYRIRAESNDQPALISFSNLLEVDLAAEVFLPNAFYPDGINNLFTVNSIFVTEYQLRIFNRWGELVHVSNQNGQGWDGTYGQTGKRAPMGTYIYNIEFTDTRNNSFTQSGPVLLIR